MAIDTTLGYGNVSMAQSKPLVPSHDTEPGPAASALAAFRERTGSEATHLAYAPGRVNLIGEHTDYNGGYVLPMAIERGITVAARRRTDNRIRIWSRQFPSEPDDFDAAAVARAGGPAWSRYVRGVVSGLTAAGLTVPGFDAVVDATLPPGSGLSSSAALSVAVATLGEALCGTRLAPVAKALLCQKAEHEFASAPCGIMDQLAIVFARRGHCLLIDCRSLENQPVPMPGHDTMVLVIDTRVRHALNDGAYRRRRDECHEVARRLGVTDLRDVTPRTIDDARRELPDLLFRRARHVTTENDRTLAAAAALRRGAWPELGDLMTASHNSLRDDFDVSCNELEAVVAAARALGPERGVFGCRMTGGGFGGCCVALVQAGQAREIESAIRAHYRAATGIDPAIFSTQPADGPAVLPPP